MSRSCSSSTSSQSTHHTSTSSQLSSHSIKMFIHHMVHSLFHPFTNNSNKQHHAKNDHRQHLNHHSIKKGGEKDLMLLQQDLNATLTEFEKTYVSFPELSDLDLRNPTHHHPSVTC
ncbi:unnamed protein product [Cunninghamella blakesleeana]